MPTTHSLARRGQRRRTVLAGAVAAALAAGTITTTASATTVPAGDPDATVVVGFVLEPENLDIITTAGAALDQVLLDNVYETLLESDDAGTVRPGLADLAVSDDGLTYTLTLHDGVTFSDGQPLTSADVAWSLETQRTDELANERAKFVSVASVEASDEATVVITLSAPDNLLAFNLSQRAGAVLQEGASDLRTTAVGTGPFTLEEWDQGSSITLARNDDYWGEAPQVAEVVFQYIPDPNAAVNALRDGDVDLFTAVNTDLVGEFADDPDWVLTTGPTNGEFTLGYNNAGEVLSDVRVRQAISRAIDKEGLLELYSGYGTVIGGPLPPFDPAYEDLTDINAYDPESAQALLEEAGYGDGLELTFVIPNFYPTFVADYVVSELAEVGVTVTVEPVEFPAWIEQVFTNHDYDLTAVLHVEAKDIYNYANPDYYWQYDDPAVQDLLARSRSTTDPAEATALVQEAARAIAEAAPVNWLILINDVIVARQGVTGYPTFDVNNRFDASGLQVTDG